MECKKCGHIWQEKKEHPKQCPSCHRYDYKEPRKWKVDILKPEVTTTPINSTQEEPAKAKEVEDW